MKLIFATKNDLQIGGFAFVEKSPTICDFFFFEKKFFRLNCADKIFKTVCGNK